ncbi:MAG: peptidase U35 [Phenylobacterium zucineum]|nr:MAG: peptidase U35 [Phenylobacterium zucineum]
MSLKQLSVELDSKAVKEDGSFEGYASVFNNVDQGRDIVLPGAFKSSLKSRPADKIKMLWQHDPSRPIGAWTDAAEDTKGLFVKGNLAMGTMLGKETYELMKMGAIDGMSIGFITLEDDYDRNSGIRKIGKADLREISVVTFPMNEAATISSVKNDLTEKDLELILREAGLSREFAKRVTLHGLKRAKESFDQREADGASENAAFVAALQHAQRLLG